jgi:Glycosyl transferase family 90
MAPRILLKWTCLSALLTSCRSEANVTQGIETSPAVVPVDGTPSTSIYHFLKSSPHPDTIVLLKWNASGILDRVSNLARPRWFSPEPFMYTKPSEHGTFAFLQGWDSMAAVPWDTTPPIPFLAYTMPKRSGNNTNYAMVPTPYDRDGFNRKFMLHAERVTSAIPFHDRKNVIVWRGTSHGWVDQNRITLAQISNEDVNNTWIDASTIGGGNDPNSLSTEEMSKYKYQIDIGGVSGTTWGGLRWKMCSGNLVFKVDSWTKDWWHDTIEPWKHYIPVKDDISDLRAQYNWVESHPTEAEEIAQRAAAICKASATEEAVAEHYENVMQSLPPASEALAKEADAILDGLGSFYGGNMA